MQERHNQTDSLVSVIIAAFNSAPTIRQAVESVIGQTYPNYEIIVVDDGSTDDTCRILEPVLDRIQYVYQENQGPSVARNHGLRLARGEFIVFLDADDTLLPEKLKVQLACFSADPSLGAIHSGWVLINRQESVIGIVEPWREVAQLDLESWVRWKPARLGAMLFRRSAIRRIGGFDPNLRLAEDVDFLLRLALDKCKMDWLRQPTMCYRQHSSLTRDARAESQAVQTMLDKFFKIHHLPRKIRRLEVRIRYDVMVWLAWRFHRIGLSDEATSQLKLSMLISPYTPELTLHNWIGQFVRHASYDGEMIDASQLITLLKKTAQVLTLNSLPIEQVTLWWLHVWRYYQMQEEALAFHGLETAHGIDLDGLIHLFRNCLFAGPQLDTIDCVSSFWQDATTIGLVPPSNIYFVTNLYLVIFARTVLARRWVTAWQALKHAIQASHSPKAIISWFSSLVDGFRFLRCRSNVDRSELPVAVIEVDLLDKPPFISVPVGYTRAMVLIRQNSRLLGQITVPVFGSRIDTAALDGILANTATGPEDAPVPHQNIPAATVVVCTRNRPVDLERCLQALLRLPDTGQEILVVDNVPLDNAIQKLVARYPGVRYLVERKPGLSAARNRALSEAKYPLVAFVDDDSVPDPHWLQGLIRNLDDPSVYCVTGLTLPLELDTQSQQWFERFSSFSRGYERVVFDRNVLQPSSSAMVGVGNNMVLRRCVLRELGPFDENLGAGAALRAGEEIEMFARILSAGYRIIYDPAALSWHRHRRTRKGVRKQVYNYGVGMYSFWIKRLLFARDLSVFRAATGWFGRYQLPALFRSLSHRTSRIPLDLVLAQLFGSAVGPIRFITCYLVRGLKKYIKWNE